MVRAWTTASKCIKAFRTGLILMVLSHSSTSVLYLREGGTGVAVPDSYTNKSGSLSWALL